MSFELLAVICLVILAFSDLIVGVVNDAVNFLNSAIGAKVASRKTIILVASIGIIIGATFSDGIIEVARKGIFNPSFFTLNEAIILFTAVALADIVLLDLYSTFGLPTSTTVSVVFELLGAAFILAVWKIGNFTEAWEVINSTSAIKIITGILLSIAIAFAIGLIVQFITRLLFTFDYKDRLKRFGFLWSGIALTCLLFFILLKGGKHATFMTSDAKTWIASHTILILGISFILFSAVSFILIKTRANILKIIVLIGTASLALAFAGNDLANFIGVSVAGVHAFLGSELSGTLPTPTWVLLLAGLIMSSAIFFSKKARTVTNTEIHLASHGQHVKTRWNSNTYMERFCRLIMFVFAGFMKIVPQGIRQRIRARFERGGVQHDGHFDLMRASVNLMIAAAVISYATSKKLPLSTTYVTFMVAMGTSLADGAWKRDCAPCRIAGVLTVIGGWFVTAIVAFIMAGITVSVLYFLKTSGLIILVFAVVIIVYKLFHVHERRTSRLT